jgi:hypothetical protein
MSAAVFDAALFVPSGLASATLMEISLPAPHLPRRRCLDDLSIRAACPARFNRLKSLLPSFAAQFGR